MESSELWLREWVGPAVDSDTLASRITTVGLEVDGVEPVVSSLHGVVAGEVVECVWHPSADGPCATKVSVGDDCLLDIICGASNCRQGLCVAAVTIGVVLPDDSKIKVTKLHGEPSEGVLCFFSELGAPDDHNGIVELSTDTSIGADIREHLKLDDNTTEISVTSNRVDYLGIIGAVRDVVVLNQLSLTELEIVPVGTTIDGTLPIIVEAPDVCPRYLDRVVEGINVRVSAPLWTEEKPRRCGIRSIDAVVDVTNYVLPELDQPVHAFDKNRTEGGAVVWMTGEGETLVLPDGAEVKPNIDILVTADRNKTLAMGGIFGGKHSDVNDETQNILLEYALFSPLSITSCARRHGLYTDVSHRYEHGVDSALQHKVMEHTTCLLIDIRGDETGPVADITNEATLPEYVTIISCRSKLDRLIGHHIADGQAIGVLRRLGCGVTRNKDE